MARPTKYTPETAQKITDALADGCTRKTAAAYAGIDESTFTRWLTRYAGFARACSLAEATCEVNAVAAVRAAGTSNWKAAAWWLERRRHAEWGRVDRLEIEIRRTAERVAAATGADPDWLVKRAAEIVAGESGGER